MNKDLPKICSFNKYSDMGNDAFAPCIFLGGCNLRCPYCMNSKIVSGCFEKSIDINTVKEYVINNNSEWIMISGGEPTCQSLFSLINLLKEIKSWKCQIGMATNGININKLEYLLKHLNYIALDIKSSNPSDYAVINASNEEFPFEQILRFKKLLQKEQKTRNDFDYEIRTTLFPPFIKENVDDFLKIIDKDEKWVLQQFRHSKNMINEDCRKIEPYNDDIIKIIFQKAKQHIKNAQIRYP